MRTYEGFGWTSLLAALVCACGASSEGGGNDPTGSQGESSSGGDKTGAAGAVSSSSGTAGVGATGGGATGVGGASQGGAGGSAVGNGGSSAVGNGGRGGAGGGSMGQGGNGGSMGGAGGGTIGQSEPPLCGAPNTPTGMPTLTQGTWTNITPPGVDVSSTYGFSRMSIDPCNPYTIYVAADQRGIFRTTNGGGTWIRLGTPPSAPDYSTTVSYLDSPLDVKIDPKNNLHLYAVQGVRGTTLGFWDSTDGGKTWKKPAAFVAGESTTWTSDVYWMSVDPTDFKHVLLSFHSTWHNSTDSGVLETKDGGATFIPHNPGGWAAGVGVNFLYDPEKGIGDAKTWLVGTQYGNGYYRTTDGGATWTNVTNHIMMHGGTSIFYSSTGVLYSGSNLQIMRSTNNGATWSLVGPSFNDGFYKVIGDGKTLYAQEANTGANSLGKGMPYMTSPETDGLTWTNSGTQTFSDGPYDLELDAKNHILYSSNWRAGVWAMKVP